MPNPYKFIQIVALPAAMEVVIDPNSEYNKGVARERALAESAPYLAYLVERVKYLELVIAELRDDNDRGDAA